MTFVPPSSRDRADLLFAVFEALPDPVFVKDSSHRWVYANKAFERLMGRNDLLGKGDEDFFPPEQVAIFHEHDRRVLAGEFTINEEMVGPNMHALTKKSPIVLPNGERGLVTILMDITAYKRAEAKMAAAEAASAAKSAFLANMSHEIRTPLNGVLGMAEALKHDGLSDTQRAKVDIMVESGHTLMAVLNDILDLSKIESGRVEIVPANVHIKSGIARIIDLFRPKAAEKGIELSLAWDVEVPEKLRLDSVRARQCLTNLLSNAIKFTETGGVRVLVRARQKESRQFLDIAVSDSGIGISETQIERLFGDFMQADESTTRRFGGTGLGLSISRRLARLMGGDITVRSEEGRGSTFTLTVEVFDPLPEAGAPPVAPLAPGERRVDLQRRRVLLTDDNAINRKVAALFMKPFGLEIVEAVNGQEALSLLDQQSFDLVLMDIHMPVMDGKEAVSRIRSSGKPWAQVPVIALTADAMEGDREKYLAMGMDAYVAKPIDQRELFTAMNTVLHGRLDRRKAA